MPVPFDQQTGFITSPFSITDIVSIPVYEVPAVLVASADRAVQSGTAAPAAVDGGSDTLKLGPGIALSDLIVQADGPDLVIGIKDPAQPDQPFSQLADQIRLKDWANTVSRVETIQLNSGETLGVADILSLVDPNISTTSLSIEGIRAPDGQGSVTSIEPVRVPDAEASVTAIEPIRSPDAEAWVTSIEPLRAPDAGGSVTLIEPVRAADAEASVTSIEPLRAPVAGGGVTSIDPLIGSLAQSEVRDVPGGEPVLLPSSSVDTGAATPDAATVSVGMDATVLPFSWLENSRATSVTVRTDQVGQDAAIASGQIDRSGYWRFWSSDLNLLVNVMAASARGSSATATAVNPASSTPSVQVAANGAWLAKNELSDLVTVSHRATSFTWHQRRNRFRSFRVRFRICRSSAK